MEIEIRNRQLNKKVLEKEVIKLREQIDGIFKNSKIKRIMVILE